MADNRGWLTKTRVADKNKGGLQTKAALKQRQPLSKCGLKQGQPLNKGELYLNIYDDKEISTQIYNIKLLRLK